MLQDQVKAQALMESILGRQAIDRYTPEGTQSTEYARADREESALARPLHGQKEPPVVLEKETPAHRIVLLLRAKGMSVKDIFVHLGGVWENGLPRSGTGLFTYQHLLTITRQAWFKKALVEILEESGMDAIQAMFKSELVPSIETLIELRDNAKSETVRLAACQSVIDRICGKATQVVESTTTHKYERVPSDLEQLDAELQTIEKRLTSGTN